MKHSSFFDQIELARSENRKKGHVIEYVNRYLTKNSRKGLLTSIEKGWLEKLISFVSKPKRTLKANLTDFTKDNPTPLKLKPFLSQIESFANIRPKKTKPAEDSYLLLEQKAEKIDSLEEKKDEKDEETEPTLLLQLTDVRFITKEIQTLEDFKSIPAFLQPAVLNQLRLRPQATVEEEKKSLASDPSIDGEKKEGDEKKSEAKEESKENPKSLYLDIIDEYQNELTRAGIYLENKDQKLSTQNIGLLTYCKKEQAIQLILNYIKSNNSHFGSSQKRELFLQLISKIKKGHNNLVSILQDFISDANQRSNLFAKTIGSDLNSQAALLYFELIKIATGRTLTQHEKGQLVNGGRLSELPDENKKQSANQAAETISALTERETKGFHTLVDYICKKSGARIGQSILKDKVLALIKNYINQKRDPDKVKLFEKLAQQFKMASTQAPPPNNYLTLFTTFIRENYLKLFDCALWKSAEDTEAATCCAKIYQALTSKEVDLSRMVRGSLSKKSPSVRPTSNTSVTVTVEEPVTQIQPSDKDIQNKIYDILEFPGGSNRASASFAAHLVHHEINHLKNLHHQVQLANAQEIAAAEAIYQRYILDAATTKAKEKGGLFDPQGHILVSVNLDQKDYEAIYFEITGKQFPNSGLSAKELVAGLLGQDKSALTSAINCNIDVLADPQLLANYKKWLLDPEKIRILEDPEVDDNEAKLDPELLSQAIDKFFIDNRRHSVISFQLEFDRHIKLTLRALRNKGIINGDDQVRLRENLLTELNTKVRPLFRDALLEAYKGETIYYNILNQKLDQARLHFRDFFRKNLKKEIGLLSQEIKEEEAKTKLITNLNELQAHDFKQTTATGKDYLYLAISGERGEEKYGHVVRVTATDVSSHNTRLAPDQTGFRSNRRSAYSFENGICDVTLLSRFHLDARTPNEMPLGSHDDAITTYANRIEERVHRLNQQSDYHYGPIFYNLYISHYGKTRDWTLQHWYHNERKRLARTLHASHVFNLKQVKEGNSERLFLVMALPTNQHGNPAKLGAKNLRGEMALMSEIAMLAILNRCSGLNEYHHELISFYYQEAHALYLSFLMNKDQTLKKEGSESYFTESKQGKMLIKKLKNLKDQAIARNHPDAKSDLPLATLAARALLQMQSHRLYETLQFGATIQMLAVFLEEVSMGGCKSAIDRGAHIEGGAAYLLDIEAREQFSKDDGAKLLKPQELKIKEALAGYINNPTELHARALQITIDTAYSDYNLQGAQVEKSLEDNGGPPKLKASQNQDHGKQGEVTEVLTSYGLPPNYSLCSGNAGDLQLHKSSGKKIIEDLQALAKKRSEEEKKATEAPVLI